MDRTFSPVQTIYVTTPPPYADLSCCRQIEAFATSSMSRGLIG